jgi:uncharacterized protein YfiM (DUF2279 family)
MLYIGCLIFILTLANDLQDTTSTRHDKILKKDEWFGRDKIHHFSYSMGIVGLTYHVSHNQFDNPKCESRLFAVSLATVFGIGKELYDKYWRKGIISYKDIVWDTLGILSGVLLFTLYERS